MHAIMLPSQSPRTCYPLTLARKIEELPAANQPLRILQTKIVEAAGFKVAANAADSGSPALFVRGDAYISEPDLLKLKNANTPAILTDKADQALAWTGPDATPPKTTTRLTAQQGFRISYPWDLLALNELLVKTLDHDEIIGSVSDAAHIKGHVVIGNGTRVLPGVYIEGNVMIGDNCKVGPNCYIRGNTSIGSDCHIGQAVEIKNSIIMDDVSVGHLSYCGDTIIASGANLGAGTITANLRHDNADQRSMVKGALVQTGRRKLGAIIGEGVHTGIHTSLYPGRKMWPGTSTPPAAVAQKDIITTD